MEYYAHHMDLERARQITHQIETMEPLKPVEGLTPLQRFSSIGERIENLPTSSSNGLGNSVSVNFYDNTHSLSLQLSNGYTVYFDGSNRPRTLISVSAKWLNKGGVFASEVIGLAEINRKYAGRILGLIEESVAEAEKVLKPKRITNSTKV